MSPLYLGMEFYGRSRSDCIMLPFIKFKMVICEKRHFESLVRHSLSKRLFLALILFMLAAVSALAQSSITVTVSPKSGGLTVGQTLTTLTATVTNDSETQAATCGG